MFSLKTGLLFVFLASSAIHICFCLGKVRLFGDASDRKTISSLYASHVCGLTSPLCLGNGPTLQRGKAALWLCLAVTPEMLKPGHRLPCALGWTSKKVARWHFLPVKSHREYWLLWLCPLLIWHIPCVQRRGKGGLKHKRGNLNLKSYLKEKLTCSVVGNNSIFLWRAQSRGRDVCEIFQLQKEAN